MRTRPSRHGRGRRGPRRRLLTDGGTPVDDDGADGADGDDDPAAGDADVDESAPEHDEEGGPADPSDPAAGSGSEARRSDEAESDRSNVEVMDAGEAEPKDPEWEPPDIDDIPEFEVRADQPVVEPGGDSGEVAGDPAGDAGAHGGVADGPLDGTGEDPTAGMPNDAQAPGSTAVSSQGTEAYVAALELCARLPDDVALPAEAADLVPAAVEAELEEDIGNFAAAEFDNPRPHVDTLDFEERDGDIWLRIRIGLPSGDFDDLDPERLRTFALQELEGVL